MRLFKYLHPDRVDVLTAKQICFSPPSNLNDPFEMKPPMTYEGFMGMASLDDADIDEMMRTTLEESLTSEQINTLSLEFLTAYREQIKRLTADYFSKGMNDIADGIYEATNKCIGVLCLSERQDDILMWAHYTNSHEGYVIEFDPQHKFFNSKKTNVDELRHLRRVRYSDDRPELTKETVEAMQALLTKSTHWSYESEWRMLASLSDASNLISLPDRNVHLFSFPSDAVKSVTIGCRASVRTSDSILKALRADTHFNSIPIYQAVPDRSEFKLNITEISRPDNFVPEFAS